MNIGADCALVRKGLVFCPMVFCGVNLLSTFLGAGESWQSPMSNRGGLMYFGTGAIAH